MDRTRFAPMKPPAPKTTMGPWSRRMRSFRSLVRSAIDELSYASRQCRTRKVVLFQMPTLIAVPAGDVACCIEAREPDRAADRPQQKRRDRLVKPALTRMFFHGKDRSRGRDSLGQFLQIGRAHV